jgi:hypothetical protein
MPMTKTIIHDIRCTLNLHLDWVVFQLDMANVFNLMFRKVIFQELSVASGDIIQFILFVCAFDAFESSCFIIIIIPSTMGIRQGDPLGRPLFVLAHFKVLHFTINCFLSCLFPSITNDIHIIGPFLIVSFTYEHFQIELRAIGLFIQLQKCVAWSPFCLPFDFNTPSQFTTPLQGIKILGVPLGTSSFTSSFIKYVLLKGVQHVDLFLRMGDVHVAFGILTHYFLQ